MKYLLILTLFALLSCSRTEQVSNLQLNSEEATANIPALPTRPNHVFVVWFENKSYSQIIGSSKAPFINSLVPKGTLFTKSYGLFHPSYPNYVAFFAGSNYGVVSDSCISGSPRNRKTMYSSLCDVNASFKWYSEGLPATGSRICSTGYYVEKHNPTTVFMSVPASANETLNAMKQTDSTKFKNLPAVACITPNLMNDMHDGSIAQGDAWLRANFATLINWCMRHNSIFIIYFDEDNRKADNRIPVVMVGQHIRAAYKDTDYHDHYSFSKSILHWFGADSTFTSNLAQAKVIQNIWR